LEDGSIHCSQITEKGKEWVETGTVDDGYWEEGGTITLDEIEEILNKEI
jgi:hypothetical protein